MRSSRPLVSDSESPGYVSEPGEDGEICPPMLRKYYYGRGKLKTYLEQLGIKYRTVR